MSDHEELCKKAMTPPVNDWGKAAAQCGKELDAVEKEIDKLEKNKKPSPVEQKKLDDLRKQRKAIHDKIDHARSILTQGLLSLSLPKLTLPAVQSPPKPPDKDLLKLPDWLSTVVKQKGIPLGDDVTIGVDNVKFDFKTMKLKSFGLTLKWKF